MKRLLLLPLLIALSFAARGYGNDSAQSLEQERLKKCAMKLMEDIVPHEQASESMMRVAGERSCAIWGKIFGDAQIGALVVVLSTEARADDNASLCLLLWQDGWKFAQWSGKVTMCANPAKSLSIDKQNWNWDLKQRAPGEPYYVVSGLDLNQLSSQEHPSWLCDQKTHSLQPTGWPEDAIPSLSEGTITFQRCENSGYGTSAYEIDQFDGKPGKNLVTYTDKFEKGGQSLITVSIPNPETGKRITWRIAPPSSAKFEFGHDRRLLCYSPVDGNLEPFHQDATVDVQWGKESYPSSAENFLIWRLTGIEWNAQRGLWDEDQAGKTVGQRPARTVVVGIPEAVMGFSWPLNPVPSVAKREAPK